MPRNSQSDRRWLWSNVPVPEPHLAAVVVALAGETVAELIARRRIGAGPTRQTRRITAARLLGAMMIAAGTVLGITSVRAAGAVDVARPEQLLTGGVYALHRNPMYLAWHLGYLGLALLTGSRWMLAGAGPVLYATHRIIRDEEEHLRIQFGVEFDRYTERVPRYV